MKRSTGILALILIIAGSCLNTGCADTVHQLTCDARTDDFCRASVDHLSRNDRAALSAEQDARFEAMETARRAEESARTAEFRRQQLAVYAALPPAERAKLMRQNREPGTYVISCDESAITQAQCALADKGVDTEVTHRDGVSYLSGISVN